MVCFALFVIGATIMSGAGRPGIAAAIAAIAGRILVIVANVLLVRGSCFGDAALIRAATAASLGTVFAPLATGAAATCASARSFPGEQRGARWPRRWVWCRTGLSEAPASCSSLVALAGGFGSVAIVLFAVGELGKTELDAVLRIVRRR